MSSYEDRMRLVALYIKLGRSARSALCEMDYPIKNALKGWRRDNYRRDNM